MRKGSKKLHTLVRDARQTLRALDVKLIDPAEEAIMLPGADDDAAE